MATIRMPPNTMAQFGIQLYGQGPIQAWSIQLQRRFVCRQTPWRMQPYGYIVRALYRHGLFSYRDDLYAAKRQSIKSGALSLGHVYKVRGPYRHGLYSYGDDLYAAKRHGVFSHLAIQLKPSIDMVIVMATTHMPPNAMAYVVIQIYSQGPI